MYKRFILLSLLLMCPLAVTLISCSDEDCPTCPDNENTTPTALFTVTVVDTLGNPVEGLRVGRINHTSHVPIAKNSLMSPRIMIWHLGVPFRGYMTMYIHDYNYQIMHVISDSSYFSEVQVYPLWYAEDSTGAEVRDGFYYCYMRMTSWTDPDLVFEGTYPAVLEPDPDPNLPANILGETDVKGVFTTNDTLFFPYLLGNLPTVRVNDGTGRLLDTLIYYSDSITVTLSDAAHPTTFIRSSQKLVLAPNHYLLIWDPSLAE
ncbi:MAG: hypothetical protein ACOYVF_11020 [Candidatus Zixiibacteriota bacterium]